VKAEPSAIGRAVAEMKKNERSATSRVKASSFKPVKNMSVTYETRQGPITVKAPSSSELSNLRSESPLGLLSMPSEDGGASFGFVTKCGDDEIWGLKQQSPEVDPKDERTVSMANLILLAHAVAGYLRHGFGGCFVPAMYGKEKPKGLEIGFAYFGKPSSTGIESAEFPSEAAYDKRFGHGFFTMFRHFYEELKESSKKTGITLSRVLGLDQRPRGLLGSLGLHCVVHGRTLYVCRESLDENDFFLTLLASAGIREAVHLPCRAVSIGEELREQATTP